MAALGMNHMTSAYTELRILASDLRIIRILYLAELKQRTPIPQKIIILSHHQLKR
jgi:hypothetical protein